MKINILGTEYDLRATNEQEDSELCLIKKVKRNKVIQAYFSESGLSEYPDNEQLADWIALHFPKLLKIFTEIDAI